MSKLQPVRGTVDLLPDVMAQHRLVIDTARHVTARYGFQEMATPIFEFSEVFSRPLGNSSDIVTKENYSFMLDCEVFVSIIPSYLRLLLKLKCV